MNKQRNNNTSRSIFPYEAPVPNVINPREFVFCLFLSSLIADGANQRATTLPIPRVVTRDLPISPLFTPTIAMQVQHSYTPRQPKVELFVLPSLRFTLRKPEEKFTPAESRTHKFRLSGRMLYPLVHGGSPLASTGTLRLVHHRLEFGREYSIRAIPNTPICSTCQRAVTRSAQIRR